MKTSDAIAKIIHKYTDTVFGVTGGNIVNLVDSFHKEGIKIVAMHHEQSAAIAADAYAKMKGFGVCFSTSGPGVTNLVTGVACSYYDSTPVLAIGGQVPSKFLDGPDRQMGFQETDGVALMRPITKYSTRYRSLDHLEQCLIRCLEPRRGPCFLEIPDDLQRSEADYNDDETSYVLPFSLHSYEFDGFQFKKPVAILGAGLETPNITIEMPFLYTWRTKERFYNHSWCKGGFGTTGGTNGNKILKEADCVLMVGTRMDSHTTPDWNKFVPQATKIAIGLEFPHLVDEKHEIDLRHASLVIKGPDWCERKDDNPDGPLYKWIDELSEKAGPEDIIIPDMGQTGAIAFQRWKVKTGQSLFNGMNHSPMGYALPGAIGATLATGRRVIVIVGDGSLMMNLHDLATIGAHRLPINIFVVNNGGYGMIRQTQKDWEKYLAQGVACNFMTPDICQLAKAFHLDITPELNKSPSIYEIGCRDTTITPKWRFGTDP